MLMLYFKFISLNMFNTTHLNAPFHRKRFNLLH